MQDGSWALCAVNFDVVPVSINCDASCLTSMGLGSVAVRDLWLHQELGVYTNLNITIGANGASRTFRLYNAA